MGADILSIATAEADYSMRQEEIAERMIEAFSLKGPLALKLKRVYQASSIRKRHSVRSLNQSLFNHLTELPKPTDLNNVYKDEAPKLALKAAKKAIERWKGPSSAITHVISASCTGMYAPGIEYMLMDALGLQRNVGRYGVNFMGCFGAFKAIGLADAIAKEDPSHRVLVVCTELCSLHLQTQHKMESLISNALFADGAAAVIIGQEQGLWEIMKRTSLGVPDTLDKMSWDLGESGFVMRLSKEVPDLLGKAIHPFVTSLTKEVQVDWAIHPGGRAILEIIEKRLSITSQQTQASWNTLQEYGNMSSPTYLFVLEELLRIGRKNPWCVGLAMGPGLSIEGMLLKTR